MDNDMIESELQDRREVLEYILVVTHPDWIEKDNPLGECVSRHESVDDLRTEIGDHLNDGFRLSEMCVAVRQKVITYGLARAMTTAELTQLL